MANRILRKLSVMRRRLWSLCLFVACAVALFLWALEGGVFLYNRTHAGYIISYDDNRNVLDDGAFAVMMGEANGTTVRKTGKDVQRNRSAPLNQSRTSREIRKPFRKSKFINKSDIPEFRWCFDNEEQETIISETIKCSALFSGNVSNETIKAARKWRPPCSYSNNRIAMMANDNCDRFLKNFNFVTDNKTVTQREHDFPLAFVVVVEKWAEQLVRLLSSVYRPHNLYCVTYDTHSPSDFETAVESVIKCLPSNVISPKVHMDIYWADISLLKTTLHCLDVLHRRNHQWRYVQLLSYNDMPLKTNMEMVQILNEFNGANDVELMAAQAARYVRFHRYGKLDERRKNATSPVPPHGLILYKGSYAATLSRSFINFVLGDQVARDFLQWSEPTWAPEEQYWATLVHNPPINAPGSFPGFCLHYYSNAKKEKTWISRHQVWYENCGGMFTSGSCVFGISDLPSLVRRPELVAHKLYINFEPGALYCLSKRHYDRTYFGVSDVDETVVDLNMTHYLNLPALKYQRLKNKDNFTCL